MISLKQKTAATVKIDDRDTGRIVGQSLKDLRKQVGLTQKQIADILGIGQAAISKIEHRGDVQISSIEKYVQALGATLKIEATFPKSRNQLNTSHSLLLDGNQLELPLPNKESGEAQRDIVLSIRPHYTKMILDGHKTIELRRRFSTSILKGSTAFIYSTTPDRAIVGSAEIALVEKLPVATIWKKCGKRASIKKTDFQTYFNGLSEGFAIEFVNVKSLPHPLSLSELRDRFGFEPPQSFLYAKSEIKRAVKDGYLNVSN